MFYYFHNSYKYVQIIIYIFHRLFKIETKSSESGFYGPLKFLFTLIGFGLAIKFLKMPAGVENLYNKIFKIILFYIIFQLYF